MPPTPRKTMRWESGDSCLCASHVGEPRRLLRALRQEWATLHGSLESRPERAEKLAERNHLAAENGPTSLVSLFLGPALSWTRFGAIPGSAPPWERLTSWRTWGRFPVFPPPNPARECSRCNKDNQTESTSIDNQNFNGKNNASVARSILADHFSFHSRATSHRGQLRVWRLGLRM
jgi:hypothetical protein